MSSCGSCQISRSRRYDDTLGIASSSTHVSAHTSTGASTHASPVVCARCETLLAQLLRISETSSRKHNTYGVVSVSYNKHLDRIVGVQVQLNLTSLADVEQHDEPLEMTRSPLALVERVSDTNGLMIQGFTFPEPELARQALETENLPHLPRLELYVEDEEEYASPLEQKDQTEQTPVQTVLEILKQARLVGEVTIQEQRDILQVQIQLMPVDPKGFAQFTDVWIAQYVRTQDVPKPVFNDFSLFTQSGSRTNPEWHGFLFDQARSAQEYQEKIWSALREAFPPVRRAARARRTTRRPVAE